MFKFSRVQNRLASGHETSRAPIRITDKIRIKNRLLQLLFLFEKWGYRGRERIIIRRRIEHSPIR